ncbi:MAG: hypothetical protein PHZ26_05675 [Candidatus Gracilibacteria bacterium]|nr:hypothetical protein [Candidatus Gracilibacteria bacterium]MDD2909206.1 hypothetical protein [Candidatus Gracilibacteria bacterium]
MENLLDSKISKFFILTIYLLISSFIFVVLFGLLFSVETFKTLIFVIGFLGLLIMPIIYIIRGKVNTKFEIIILSLVIFSLLQGFQLNYANDGNYKLRCLDDCTRYNYNPLNVIQEKEFLNTGFKLAWFLSIPQEQLSKFKDIELKYEKSVLIDLPSQIPNATINQKEQKYIIYKPTKAKKDKLLIVLHGNAGGFQLYQKFFKQFADKYNVQVATPAFGWGNWYEIGGTELIYNTYNDLLAKQEITKDTEVIIIGLSAGGWGLTRAVYYDNQGIFDKVVYISAVMENGIMESPEFIKNSKNKKFYVIQGKVDDRVFYKSFLECQQYLQNPKTLIFDDGDHFIMLNKEKEVVSFMEKVIEK